jgi:cytochrome c peroxidase
LEKRQEKPLEKRQEKRLQTLLGNLCLPALVIGASLPVLLNANPESLTDDQLAWLAFKNARGEPSLILGDLEHPSANDVFRIIPEVTSQPLDAEKLQLGFDLFNEKRLSRDGSIACSSCHIGLLGGVDRRPLPFGIDGARGDFNVPTILNASLNFRQFWDGRALTLQEQALGPIENPAEFGHDLDGAIAVLNSIPEYASAFGNLYPDGVTVANLSDAIAYYETMNFTGLRTPFLRQFDNDGEVLSSKALRGQQRFVEVGCASCHNGINLGGNSYQQLGVAKDWYDATQTASDRDDGLFGRTGRIQDKHVFKVPTLHNVATTGPWLHDGSVTSLQQAVDQMARKQSGRYLDNRDIDDIVAFLRTLGDPQSLIGDCTASGNYAIILDCDVKQVTAEVELSPVDRTVLPDPDAVSTLHLDEYAAARDRTAAAPERIKAEMQRISSGEVAHFDFLQFEHIEMMRHALALSFPPANISPQQRRTMLEEAAQWQQSAREYELQIADFLRSQAVIGSARANYQDILNQLSIDADERIQAMLARAERSALAFYTDPNSETLTRLEAATEALKTVEVDPRLINELALQVRLLGTHTPFPQA